MKQYLIKNRLWVVLGSVLLILSISYYFIFIYNSEDEDLDSTTGDSNSINNSLSFPIKQGDSGKQVKQLQNYLNKKFNAGLTTDGNWGPKTQVAFDGKFPIADKPGYNYSQLTLALYNKLNLKNY